MIGAVGHVSRHFTAYACLAYAVAAVERIGEAILEEGPYYESRDRLITQYLVNYPDHGFAKRAVVGTLLRPLTGALETPEHLVYWLMVGLSLAALAAVVLLTRRFLPHREGDDGAALIRCALAIGPLGVMQVAHDLGRFDPINLGLLILAVAAAGRGRLALTALLCAVAILIHEAFALYGAPLALAVAWHAQRDGLAKAAVARRLAPLVVAVAAVSLAVLLFGNSEDAVAVTHGTGGYVWKRGLIEFGGPTGPLDIALLTLYWAALFAVFFGLGRAGKRRLPLLALAALCPLALNLLGIDHARWLTLGFYAAVINLAAQRHALGAAPRSPRPGVRRAGYLLCLPLGPMGVVDPLAWLP